MLGGFRQTGKLLLPVTIISLIVYISVTHVGYIQLLIPTNTEVIIIEPVNSTDWKANLPKYEGVPENVFNTEWWKSAAFMQWDLQNRPVDYGCKTVKSVGNWWVCMDDAYKISPPCLVYSFGIGFDFSFDDDMAKLGCEVHSFDPSMKMKEHYRNNKVHFHPIGLSHIDSEFFKPRTDMYVKDNSSWPVMTIHTIMRNLGHTGRKLDVLKIDVEGYEWNIIDYFIKHNFFSNVKQFMLEYHLFPTWPSRSEYPKLLKLYKTIHDLGFLKFVTAMHPLNHKPESFNIQADVAYVNSHYGKNS